MRIVVDFDRCQSNGLCMEIAPDLFEVRDDGYLYVLDDSPPDEVRSLVDQAVAGCPTMAISLED